MSFNLQNHKKDLLFLPLGGAGEIGMNVNLYHLNGKWLMIDCGAGFADDHLPGIDMMVADISFIAQHKDDIVGLVLTHAHEDHLGAVPYLWGELECPIYTTKFTANFLKRKLGDSGMHADDIPINIIQEGSKIDLGPFNLEMVPLTHSAPEMQAVMVRTEKGNILHTGDWKFDHDPLIGEPADEKLLKSLGDEGVLALVCDSTNVFNKGTSGSEGDLRKSLVDIIKSCPKMAFVTTFASNLARIETLIYAAKEAGRKVVISGRSLHRVIGAAKDSGYLQDIDAFVDERDISRHKREDLLVIATGCQGEPLAATSKVAFGVHQNLKLLPGDTVIFSSKIIPGNDKKIFNLFNIFVKNKIEVITEKDHFVHVSGHPGVEELQRMYELVRPQIAVPVHGELVHIHEHARLAREDWKVKHAVEPENGSVVRLDKLAPSILGLAQSGYLGIDGEFLLNVDSPILKMRRRMRDAGIVVISLVLGEKKLAARPLISCPGCLDRDEDIQLIYALRDEISETVNSVMRSRRSSHDNVAGAVRSLTRKFIRQETGKKPIIEINIEQLKK